LQLLNEGRFRRTTVPVPTAGWAALRHGQPDLDRLWDEVLIACRADASVAEWDERMDALERRSRRRRSTQCDFVGQEPTLRSG
jgi:hypothetical protein